MQKRVLSLVLLITLLCGCGENSSKVTERQVLRMSINRDPTTLDPRKGGEVVSSLFHFLLFEGLTKKEEDGSITPALAEHIALSEDALVYTFTLRNALWSDGTPITADDVAYAWKNVLDPSFPSPNPHLFYAIKNAEAAKKGEISLDEVGIHVIDSKTLQVHLATPTPQFLEIISFCSFSPVKSGIDAECAEWAYGPGTHYLSNGPYLIKNWKHNAEITLIKNPLYWNKDLFNIETIQIYVIDNEMTALHMYENGELDILSSILSPIPVDALVEYIQKGQLNTIQEPGTTVCFFNTEKFPFNNVNIRKAFGLSLYREEIVKNITQLNEEIATGIIPNILKQKNRPFFQDNDVETARRHLKAGLEELGLTKVSELGPIIFSYSNTEINRKIAEAIQQQWFKTLGVQVKLEQFEYKTLVEKMSKRTYMISQGLWLAQYQDQMNILERFKTKKNVKNYPGWENPLFSLLLEESNYARTPEERFVILEKAEELLVDEMPISPIFHWTSALLAKPYLTVASCTPTATAFYEKMRIKNQSNE